MGEKCHFCQAEATKLCDAPMKDDNNFYTPECCDLPICEECATEEGTTFDLVGVGKMDTIDSCPWHSGKARREYIR